MAKNVRKPTRDVQLDDIISNQILGTDGDVLALVLKIHLALEAILIEIIRSFETEKTALGLNFPGKTKRLVEQGLINASDKTAFDRVNDVRNDFAHTFAHQFTLTDALALARDLEGQGIDFSDSAGHYSEAEATEYYDGLEGILEEIGWCVLFHAAYLLMEAGGRDIFGAAPTQLQSP